MATEKQTTDRPMCHNTRSRSQRSQRRTPRWTLGVSTLRDLHNTEHSLVLLLLRLYQPGSSVNIVTVYGRGDWVLVTGVERGQVAQYFTSYWLDARGLIPGRVRYCPFNYSSWASSSLSSCNWKLISSSVKQPKHETNHSLPPTAQVRKAWSPTFTPSYIMVCCLMTHEGKHYFNFLLHHNTELNIYVLKENDKHYWLCSIVERSDHKIL